MRSSLILLPLLLCAAPALAQPANQYLPPQLTDPATADRLTDMMQALSKAFLDLPVGEVQAAAEGRQPTPDDRRRTIGSETRIDERELRRQIADAKPMIQNSMKALAEAVPAMMRSIEDVERAIERATANLPDPTYPRR